MTEVLRREVPPTAGLPLRVSDWWRPPPAPLAEGLSAFLGVPDVGLTCSGTAALVYILRALSERQPGRQRVLVPAFNCPLVVHAIHACGLTAVPVDVRAGSFEFDLQRLADLLDDSVLAIVPTHLAGRVADLTPFIDLAARFGASVIEDAAQALGARVGGRTVGLQGDAGFFSLAVGKGLSLFEGGVWLSRDAGLARSISLVAQRLARPASFTEAKRVAQLAGYTALYRPTTLQHVYGRPLRAALARGDILAALDEDFGDRIPLHPVSSLRQRVGANAITRLAEFQRAAAARAESRVDVLRSISGVDILGDAPGSAGVWPVLLLRLPDAVSRDRVLADLWPAGLGVSRLFAYALRDYPGLLPAGAAGLTPNAEDFAATTLTVSNSPWLDDDGFMRVMAAIASALR